SSRVEGGRPRRNSRNSRTLPKEISRRRSEGILDGPEVGSKFVNSLPNLSSFFSRQSQVNYLGDSNHVASSHSQSRKLRDAESNPARVGVMATRLQVSGNQLPVHNDVHLLELALNCTAVPVPGHIQGNLL